MGRGRVTLGAMRFLVVLGSCFFFAGCASEPAAGDPDARGSDGGAPASDAGDARDAGQGMDAAAPDDAAVPAADAGRDAIALPDTSFGDAGPPMAEGCLTDVGAGHHVLPCDGITYDVEISPACAMGGCGVIFDVHGATMSADDEDRNTGLRALGPAHGYVVVQPTAPDGTLGPSWDPARDDPKILDFLLLTLRALRIDPDRVHFTGFSQGGYMTWRMLCHHAELFGSVAPGAAATGTLFEACSFSATERPSVEVPVLYLHGHHDRIVNWTYGAMQRDRVVAGWSMALDTIVSMDGAHAWTRWRSPTGNPFELVEHDYDAYSRILAGHCFPGSTDVGTDRFGTTGFACADASPVVWGEAVIAFFDAHPRG